GIAPGRGMDADGPHEGAQMQLAFGHDDLARTGFAAGASPQRFGMPFGRRQAPVARPRLRAAPRRARFRVIIAPTYAMFMKTNRHLAGPIGTGISSRVPRRFPNA